MENIVQILLIFVKYSFIPFLFIYERIIILKIDPEVSGKFRCDIVLFFKS